VAVNLSTIPADEFETLAMDLDKHGSLREVLAWASSKPKDQIHPHIVADVVTQDEFTHDVIVPYKDLFLVYDLT
jgi:hypothetical protein